MVITVAVCTYNRACRLERCLRSMMAMQRDVEWFAPTFARMLDVELEDVDRKPIHELLPSMVRGTEPGKAMREVAA